ncbi:HNH endonuclease [Burkholderia sp. LMU1-1-1.1]|uniref:HNH endonuclease n=1 Tax=Burkholderia sp. LMU1-1-1.1 TaxID=3135266 RepID=UPI0034483CB9
MQRSTTNMDKIWVATASLLFPNINANRLVAATEIRQRVQSLFGTDVSAALMAHLVAWKDRNLDKQSPSRGGSRNRYLFKTSDGAHPSAEGGGYRLYQSADARFDGEGKDGPTCPGVGNISVEYEYLRTWYLDDYLGSLAQRELEERAAEEAILSSELTLTEKVMLTKSRIGQGVFKARVAQVEARCRLTGVADIRFLIASHIKPWAKCCNKERLDGHNGLLLSPHADFLFDRGYFTFKRNGEVIVASDGVVTMREWSLTPVSSVALSSEQEEYMRYHRRNVFRGALD